MPDLPPQKSTTSGRVAANPGNGLLKLDSETVTNSKNFGDYDHVLLARRAEPMKTPPEVSVCRHIGAAQWDRKETT